MTDIKKIEKFKFDSDDYLLRIGDCSSYNSYYAVSISYKNELINIGLQVPDTGIPPQVEVFNSRIVIGAGEDVYVWDPNMKEPMHYALSAPFYEFYIVADNILIVYEIGVFALNDRFDKIWEKSFSEIIDIEKIDRNIIFLKDYNGNTIKLDAMTGECIR